MQRSAAIALVVIAAACAPKSSSGPTGTLSAPAVVASTLVAASVASTTPAFPKPLEIARRHAPLYRFNAWVHGSTLLANVSEDYFPMSVKEYFDELAAGRVRVAIAEANGPVPGANEVRTFAPPTIEPTRIVGVPENISGDAPGSAPVYCHVYEDKTSRVRNADGSGTDLYYVEFWIFYGRDRSREKLFSRGPVLDLGGHRADWEMIEVAVELDLGPGGAYRTTRVARAFYTGHNDKRSVELQDLELVDDSGKRDPAGTHPVVYVSAGKHASFPHAGHWKDIFGLLPEVEHDEVFLGNGARWSSWNGTLHDFWDKNDPEFTPPSFAKLLDPTLQAQKLTDWRNYDGRFGDDLPPVIPFLNVKLPFADSPRAPTHQTFFGTGAAKAQPWRSVVGSHGLVLGPVADVVPAPVPVRR